MNTTRVTANLGIFLILILVFIYSVHAVDGEENFLIEDYILIEEHYNNEELFYDEELLLSEELTHDEELFLSEETVSDNELLLSEETPYDEEYDYSYIFDAPDLVFEAAPIFELRSFDEIFPNFSPNEKRRIFSSTGLRNSFERNENPTMVPDSNSGIEILNSVMRKNPSHAIEALVVIPYNEREFELLDIYNALGKIENIKEHSIPINGRDFFIFMDTTRLESAQNRRPIPDPPSRDRLPLSETMFMRFTDAYMGDLFIRGDISICLYGITYNMTNFTDVRYSLFRIMRAERFSIIIYLEPVKEGVLVYSMSGLYLPGFIARRINLSANINVRIMALISWIAEGLKRQESEIIERELERNRHDNRFHRIN